jgi:hypothetical protein
MKHEEDEKTTDNMDYIRNRQLQKVIDVVHSSVTAFSSPVLHVVVSE